MTERTIHVMEKAYTKLEVVAKALEFLSPNNAKYVVQDVYLDFGLDWMWTTIVRRGYRECQVLSPRDWQNIMKADSLEELFNCVDDIRNGTYFTDN